MSRRNSECMRMRGPPLRSPAVIGRAGELAALAAGIDRARAGHGATVVLTGEPGVGKSRLLRAVHEHCRDADAATLVGRAVDTATTAPFRPLTEALLGAVRAGPVLDDREVVPFRSALAPLLQDGVGPSTAPSASLLHVAEGFLRVARASGRDGRGVAVLLDDLHWADAETLSVLEYLADNIADEPVLVVATSRPGVPDVLRALIDRRAATELWLGPLHADHVVALIRSCLGDASVPAPVLDLILDRADGIPFFVEELLVGLESDGMLVQDAGRWTACRRQRGRPPVTFGGSVRRRLGLLPEAARELLVDAALLGRRIDPDLLGRVAGIDAASVDDALRAAGGLALVEDSATGVRFRHALTRDVLLGELRETERAGRCRVALRALRRARPDLPDELVDVASDLAEAAGERAEAVELLERAGRRALNRGALTSAETVLRRAVTLSSGTPAEPGATTALVRTLAVAGRVEDAFLLGEVLLARLVDRAGEVDPDGARRFAVHVALARAAAAATDWALAGAHLDRARALDPAPAPQMDTLAAVVALGEYRVDEAASHATVAVREAERDGDAEALCEALIVHGRCLRMRDMDAAARTFGRAGDEARSASLVHLEARALTELGFLASYGCSDDALLREALALAGACGAPETEAVAHQALAGFAQSRADARSAIEHADTALALARRFHLGQLVPATLVMKAAALALGGDTVAVEAVLAEAGDLAGDEPTEVVAAAVQARAVCAYARDDPAAAAVHLAAAADRARTSLPTAMLPMLPLHVLVRAAAGDDPRPVAADLARWTAGGAQLLDAVLAAAEAVRAGRAGDPGATAALDRALADLDPAPFLRAVVARLAAGAADGWGDPVRWLTGAAASFDGLGLAAAAASCRAAAGPARRPCSGLTARESEVLGLLRDGTSNRDIAGRLVLSVRTVEKHVERLLAKTGTANRTQLATYALRRQRDT